MAQVQGGTVMEHNVYGNKPHIVSMYLNQNFGKNLLNSVVSVQIINFVAGAFDILSNASFI